MPPPGLDALEHLVVLMMENRSFDHMLGALKARDPRILLLLGWVVCVVLFFSLSSGKREVYILPALPMLCVAMGPWLHDVVSRRGVGIGAFIAAVLFSGVLLAAGLAAALGHPGFEDRLASIRGTVDGDALGWMLAAIGGAGLLAALILRPKRGVAALCHGHLRRELGRPGDAGGSRQGQKQG